MGHDPARPEDQGRTMAQLAEEVIHCRRCPRLVEYIAEVARTKRRAYQDWEYWGRPVPSLGDPYARLLVVGLAPAAHGGNRTGRMFTGDGSADWLIRAMYRAGFANQPTSIHRDDGLELSGAYITAVCHCAPPQNKPTTEEIARCRPFLTRELDGLKTVKVIVCLGRLAFDNVLRHMRERGYHWPALVSSVTGGDAVPGTGSPGETEARGEPPRRRKPPFRHGGEYVWDPPVGEGDEPPVLIASYHPSRQNTNTGVLTEAMFDAVFRRARELV